MSSGMNRVTLFGNLGADPELRALPNGQGMLKLRLATNDAWYDKDKRLVERTDWHDVVVFGSRAEPLSRILAKGDTVFVYGQIRYSSYEKDGIMRYRTEIVARDVGLSSKRGARAPMVAASAGLDDPYVEVSTAEIPLNGAAHA